MRLLLHPLLLLARCRYGLLYNRCLLLLHDHRQCAGATRCCLADQLGPSRRSPNLLLIWLLLLLVGPELLQSGLDCLPLLLCGWGCLWLRRAATAVGLWHRWLRACACACCTCLLLLLLLVSGTLLHHLLLEPQQVRKHLGVLANTCRCNRLLLLLLLTSRTDAAK